MKLTDNEKREILKLIKVEVVAPIMCHSYDINTYL
jgi:hypothetical protein